MVIYEWKEIYKGLGSCVPTLQSYLERFFLFSFYGQQMFDNFYSNSDCVIPFFLGAWVCVEYQAKMMNSHLYWELKNP